jgi:hypothetical protein
VSPDHIIKVADMILKLKGAYPATKTAHMSLNLKGQLEGMKYQDLIKRHLERRKDIDQLIGEAT